MNKKEKLGDLVINQIKADIASGKFNTGEKMPAEPELMKLYGVGRSTIREGIKTLANAGVLKVQQGSGTFVNNVAGLETIDQRLKRADFEEINAVRKLLENEIVTLASQFRSEKHILEIEECLKKKKIAIQSENKKASVDSDIAFHMAIARASLNTVLADLYQSFTAIIRDFFDQREIHGISHFAMSYHLHEDLFKAIKAGKTRQAQQIIKNILENNY